MKKFLFIILWSTLFQPAFSQEVASLFLEQFNNDDNLEVVSIGEKMFQMMADVSPDNENFNEAIKGLEKLIVISSKDSALNHEYYNSAFAILTKKKSGFESILSSKEGQEELVIMSKESKGIVKELILLQRDSKNNFSLISLSGEIDLKNLIKYSSSINLSGLQILDSINKNEEN